MPLVSVLKYFLILILSILILFNNSYAEEQSETARLITRTGQAPRTAEKDKLYAEAFYEISDVVVGQDKGHWSEATETFGYYHKDIFGYLSVSSLERLDVKDYTANFGAYVNIDKDSYAHLEAGFGFPETHYIYDLQTIIEYGHRLYDSVYWQAGYNYRNYASGDSHTIYPGLLHYFGNSNISLDYGVNFIEGRDMAQFGVIKGSFAITEFLSFEPGAALGERLYDIYGLSAGEERGYIIFGIMKMRVYKEMALRLGGSYSEEDPRFIKRSLIFSVSAKF
jgi:hypothetical protein